MKTFKVMMFTLAGVGLSIAALLGVRAVMGPATQEAQSQFANSRSAVAREPEADRRVASAEAIIKRMPGSSDGYNRLAAAYLQKARDTDDSAFNAKAEKAIHRSLELEIDNFDGLSLRAALLLTYHRFGEALDIARRAQRMRPDNSAIYGAITDAMVELGDYRGAIEAAQKMVDLRPGTPAFARISYLRALHGDTNGAIEAMRLAVEAADARNPESVAWCRVQLGNLLMNAGRSEEAGREYAVALTALPDFNHALEAQAGARVRAKDYESAITLYKKVQERGSHFDVAIALGDLYTKLGRADEAKRQYDLAEFIMSAGDEVEPRNTVIFWVDQDRRLDEALAIALRERSRRCDIYTSDALAWCFFKKGMLAEARAEIDAALRLGTRDARLAYHAGMIYGALGDRQKAAKYLRTALEINPSFHILQADAARRTLSSLKA